jgi:hypothetical protein
MVGMREIGKMKEYEVSVSLEYRTKVIVQAEDIYEANDVAQTTVAEIYTVYNSDGEQHEEFDYITAYEPEEL